MKSFALFARQFSVPAQDYNPSSMDCVLLVKEWLTSSCLSQKPQTLLPAAYLDRLVEGLHILARNPLTDRERSELLGLTLHVGMFFHAAAPLLFSCSKVPECREGLWCRSMVPERCTRLFGKFRGLSAATRSYMCECLPRNVVMYLVVSNEDRNEMGQTGQLEPPEFYLKHKALETRAVPDGLLV